MNLLMFILQRNGVSASHFKKQQCFVITKIQNISENINIVGLQSIQILCYSRVFTNRFECFCLEQNSLLDKKPDFEGNHKRWQDVVLSLM